MSVNPRCLHVANNSNTFRNKFVPDYASMLTEHARGAEHDFIFIGDNSGLGGGYNFKILKSSIFDVLRLIYFIKSYDKVVFHTLPATYYIILMPLFLKLFKSKYYLALWGGEVHFIENNSYKSKIIYYFSMRFLKVMHGFITYLVDDYDLARKKSNNLNAELINVGSFYPSNIVIGDKREFATAPKKINIMIGASAIKRNAHQVIIDRLSYLNSAHTNIKYYIPLSYGDSEYARFIESYALEKLGKVNVEILKKFIEPNEYRIFLSRMDVAIFGHDGQQGMGNILNLLSLGVKVYLNPSSTSWAYLESLGFDIFDYENINLDICNLNGNVTLANDLFSLESTISKQNNFYSDK